MSKSIKNGITGGGTCYYTNPILTVLEGNTGNYKPADCSTSPTEGRACAKSKGLYFQVLPSKTVSIGFITRMHAFLMFLKFKLYIFSFVYGTWFLSFAI